MSKSILDVKLGDVTGDGILDKIVLIGDYLEENSPAVKNLQLLITDGNTFAIYKIDIPDVIGYNPTLFLFPFRDSKVNDIFISIASGGSGGFYFVYIYGYEDNKFIKLFGNNEFEQMFKYQVNYVDDYQVEVINDTLQKKFKLDISYKDQDYLDELYHDDGTLKKPTFGDVLGLNQAFPIDIDNDGIFELLTFQRIIGLYNADLLGYLETVLAWKNNQFEIFYDEQFLAMLPSDLY